MALPDRLDNATLDRVKALASSALPAPIPCSDRHFGQCLRVMLAVLPKRQSDDLSGELFVAAYQRKLGHLSEPAISFLADKAMERHQWFPTIHECLELVKDYRRRDEYVERRELAQRIVNIEQSQRLGEERKFRDATNDRGRWGRPPLTDEEVAAMDQEMIRIGLQIGALIEKDGVVQPAWRESEAQF